LTLDQNLEVMGDISGVNGDFSGDLDVAGAGTFDTLEVNELTVTMSVWLPECPQGYLRDDRRDIILCTDGLDEMVKVGDFWVDRYESSVWQNADCSGTPYGRGSDDYPGTFPDHGSFSAALFACSVRGVQPSRYLTWFQAQAACSASGKSLISNAEWQAAVEGTYDPESSSVRGRCLTSGAGPRPTGDPSSLPPVTNPCISIWGAEDMIGNLWEWTSDWWQAGPGWMASTGQTADSWPDGYSGDNDDRTWNLDGAAVRLADFVNGLPAAAQRGGSWNDGTRAGAFALNVDYAPTYLYSNIGFRCARGF
jgi:formylglycine-generating enzyme required for sulfatase activity